VREHSPRHAVARTRIAYPLAELAQVWIGCLDGIGFDQWG
jgi:hypothetical protein